MKKLDLFGNGRFRYYIAESFVIANFVGHSLNEVFGINRLLEVNECPRDVVSCAIRGALVGYILGGTIDLMNYITNYIVGKVEMEKRREEFNKLEKKADE